jgi:hypothetical protein
MLGISVEQGAVAWAMVVLSFLGVTGKDVLSPDADGVDQADDNSIDREGLRFGGEAGAGALGDEDELAFAGAERVDGDEGAAGRDEPVTGLVIEPVGLDDEELVAGHRFGLLRGHDRSGHEGDEHQAPSFWTSSITGLPGHDQLFVGGNHPDRDFGVEGRRSFVPRRRASCRRDVRWLWRRA